MNVLFVLGTRPEAIKMAPVIQRMKQHDDFIVSVCVTAQHRQMLDDVLSLFQIEPDFDLNLMRNDQGLTELTGQIFQHIGPVIQKVNPDWMLVQGDTTTVMAAGIAAFYHKVKVGHIEAGLRTHNKYHPFPEEINRRIVGVFGDCHFAPTESAQKNLLREGVDPATVFVTGNTVIDALMDVSGFDYNAGAGPLKDIPGNRRIILVTAHRRENLGAPLVSICKTLRRLATRYHGDVHIVYPVHLNPRVKVPVYELLDGVDGITLLDPLDYHSLVYLMNLSYLILTDSGGIQEEAPALGKPVLVLREVTERPEGVEAGTAKVVGTDSDSLWVETCRLLDSPEAYRQMANAVNPYGDGQSSKRICDILLSYPQK